MDLLSRVNQRKLVRVRVSILNTLLQVETALRKDIEVKGAEAPFFYEWMLVVRLLILVRAFAVTEAPVFVAWSKRLDPLITASKVTRMSELYTVAYSVI